MFRRGIKRTGSKYHNEKVVVDGIKFDSKKESKYYLLFKEKEKSGEIRDLRMQVSYELIPKVVGYKEEITKRGIVKIKEYCKQRPTYYVADFVYKGSEGNDVVVDVKSAITRKNPAYILKRKMMLAFKGIEIQEV